MLILLGHPLHSQINLGDYNIEDHGYDLNDYNNSCTPSGDAPDYPFGVIEAYFEDQDGDCKSDFWVVLYINFDGTFDIWGQNRWRDETGRTTTFDFNGYDWQCCGLNGTIGSNSPGGGGGSFGGWTGTGTGFNHTVTGSSCGCEFEINYDEDGNATVTVSCPCVNEN